MLFSHAFLMFMNPHLFSMKNLPLPHITLRGTQLHVEFNTSPSHHDCLFSPNCVSVILTGSLGGKLAHGEIEAMRHERLASGH